MKPIADTATRHGAPPDKALEISRKFWDELATFDEAAFKKNEKTLKVKTFMFFSPVEREEIGKQLVALLQESRDAKDLDKKVKWTAGKVQEVKLKDAADIALFGRMVATDHSLTVEGAGMFSHALSMHRADNDIHFYTVVDDRQREDPTIEED